LSRRFKPRGSRQEKARQRLQRRITVQIGKFFKAALDLEWGKPLLWGG
jgi:hypothetical protein